MESRPVRILITDWIPSLNKGELAILFGILKSFDAIGNVEVSIFSACPEIDSSRYPWNIRIVDVGRNLHIRNPFSQKSNLEAAISSISAMLQHILFSMLYVIIGKNVLRIFRKPIWREYCDSDVIIICHDQMNFVVGARYMLFCPFYINLMGKNLKKPTVIYGTGIYKLRKALIEDLGKYMLRSVDLTTLREEDSFTYLKSIAIDKAPIYLTAEPAILMPAASNSEVKKIAIEEGVEKDSGLLIGVTLSRLTLLSAYPNCKDPYRKAVMEFANFFDMLTNNVNAKIVFLPHSIEHYSKGDDREVAKDVFDSMKNKHNAIMITKEYSPQELKGLMGTFDMVIGTRVHSIVNALCMNVPSIIVSGSPSFMRTNGIVGGTLGQRDWIFPIEKFKPERLYEKVIQLLFVRNEVHEKLKIQTKVAYEKAMLNGILLNDLLKSRAKR